MQRSPALKKTAGSVQMNFSSLTRQELKQATLQLNLWEKNTFSLADRLLRSARLAGGELHTQNTHGLGVFQFSTWRIKKIMYTHMRSGLQS